MNDSRLEQVRNLTHNWFFPLVCGLREGVPPEMMMVGEYNSKPYDCQFTERFLQALWNEQRFCRELATEDGRAVDVLSPGTWNVSAGPDFSNAVIRLDGSMVRGDIEVHRTVADWHAHGHSRDPAYRNVILHVVWRAGSADAGQLPPTLELAGFVDGGLDALTKDLAPEFYPYGRKVGPGRCAEELKKLSDDQLCDMFRAAGLARLAGKSQIMLKTIAERGVEQALYEGVMSAMGYHKNKESFRHLAASASLELLTGWKTNVEKTAVLWGVSGLLPDPSTVPVVSEMKHTAMTLWHAWWKTGIPPGGIKWDRAGCRPLNSPERRMAAACRWLQNCSFSPVEHLLRLIKPCTDGKDMCKVLEKDLIIRDSWESCISYEHALKKPVSLIGSARRRDIVVNIFIPFLHALATYRHKPSLTDLTEKAWLEAPKLQENRKLTEGIHRFLYPPSRGKTVIRKACEQQGALEMYQALCMHCGGNCSECALSSINPAGKIV